MIAVDGLLELLQGLGLLFGLTLFGLGFLGIIVISLFILGAVISDVKREGRWLFAVFLGIIALFYFAGSVANTEIFTQIFTLNNILWYVGIGFVYMLVRVLFFGRDEQKRVNKNVKERNEHPDRYFSSDDLTIETNLLGHFSRWWSLWIISLPVWFLEGWLLKLGKKLYQIMKRPLLWILKLGASTVDVVVDEVAEKKKLEKEAEEKEKATYEEKEKNHPN